MSTSREVGEQCTNAVTMGIKEISSAVKDYTKLFEESFEVLNTPQEDSNIQSLETEACELQQNYNDIKGTMRMVALTQRLPQMQQS